jgi:PAS domain S-box-containing protein
MTRRLTALQANFYKDLVRRLPMGIAIIHLADPKDDKTWKLVANNSIASNWGGTSVADILALPVIDTHPKRNSSRHTAVLRHVITKNKVRLLGQMRKENKPGSGAVSEVLVCPLAENCVGVLFENVSRRERTLDELREVESQLEQMRESARAIQWCADPATFEFTHVSKEARSILGYSTERWQTETNFWKKRTHAEDWTVVEENCIPVRRGDGNRAFECRMLHADGRILWFHAYVRLASSRARRPELAGLFVDVTDQKRAEESARQLSMRVMQAQEEDRRRISRELHDSIGQYLTGLKFGIAEASSDENCGDAMREKLNECAEMVRTCMEEIRSVSNLLHPPLLDILGLVPALRWYARHFSERSAIALELDTPQEMQRLDQETELTLFRIFQECLTNIQRHAKTTQAKVRLSGDEQSIVLEVEDAGIGLPPNLFQQLEIKGGGIGLLKMRERVADLYGKLEFHSNGKGTLVRARIPKSTRQPAEHTYQEETGRGTVSNRRQRHSQ